jgi:CheY-like chemotaxis protein
VAQTQAFLAGKRCLVLDDEFLIALDLQEILQGANAIVTSFGNAADAMAALGGGARFDLAVLDIRLEEAPVDCMAIAALLDARGTPFIFLTGLRVDNPYAQKFPAAPVVEKPYQAQTLMDALRRALAVEGKPEPDAA